jgi:FAD synthase
MAAALAGAGGGGALVAVVPLHVDEEIDSRITPLCVGVAEVKEAAAALKLKMRVNDRHEVFQLWELPDEEEEEQDFSSSLLNKLQRGGQIEGQKQLVGFPLYYRGPPSFDLEEECK